MIEAQSAPPAARHFAAKPAPDPSRPDVFHIVCERDVGLFNLILGVIPHTYWALAEGRIPIIYYGKNNCYWTPKGYRGRDSVWEYYFEPVIPEYPVSRIPAHVLNSIADDFSQGRKRGVGYFIDESAFVSNDSAWHIEAAGGGLRGPVSHRPPSRQTRALASTLVRRHIRPRDYIVEMADAFFEKNLADRYLIGVHIRGTDALVDATRHVRQGGVDFARYIAELRRLRGENPDALIFIASDEQAAVDRIRDEFDGVVAYDSVRHQGGEIAGKGPAGGIMPAYLTQDPDRTAKNGEDAVVEYLLLCRCDYLVHNLSSIPRMVMLTMPDIPETNTDVPSLHRRAAAVLRRKFSTLRRRVELVGDTLRGQPIGSWGRLLSELRATKRAARAERARSDAKLARRRE